MNIIAGSPWEISADEFPSEASEREKLVEAGRALSRLLLTATQHGLTAALLSQPIEVDDLRQRLAAGIREPGFPQLMPCMGYADAAPPTPRRDPVEVLRMPNGA